MMLRDWLNVFHGVFTLGSEALLAEQTEGIFPHFPGDEEWSGPIPN